MKGTERLHGLGQSLWLDYISRDLLDSGKLKRYIDEFSVTGLTSNPTIFDQAINNSTAYDAAIRHHSRESNSAEELFFGIALEDISRAAELFRVLIQDEVQEAEVDAHAVELPAPPEAEGGAGVEARSEPVPRPIDFFQRGGMMASPPTISCSSTCQLPLLNVASTLSLY